MPMPTDALVVFADAALHRSRLGRRVGEAARKLPDVAVRDLYELYPDFFVDVRAERTLVLEAPLLVCIFHLGWFGMPSLLKEWFDTVFKADWARPEGAGCLAGKRCWAIVDCNDGPEDFGPHSRHGRPLTDFLLPLEMTARACGMTWLEPHIHYAANRADAAAIEAHTHKLYKMLSHLIAADHGR